jgi:hypothetical protein
MLAINRIKTFIFALYIVYKKDTDERKAYRIH